MFQLTLIVVYLSALVSAIEPIYTKPKFVVDLSKFEKMQKSAVPVVNSAVTEPAKEVSNNLRVSSYHPPSYLQVSMYSDMKCRERSMAAVDLGVVLNQCVSAEMGYYIMWSALPDTPTAGLITGEYAAFSTADCSGVPFATGTDGPYPAGCTNIGHNMYGMASIVPKPPTAVAHTAVGFAIFPTEKSCKRSIEADIKEYAIAPLGMCVAFNGFGTGSYMLNSCTGSTGDFKVTYTWFENDNCSGKSKIGAWTTAADTCNNPAMTINDASMGYLNARCMH